MWQVAVGTSSPMCLLNIAKMKPRKERYSIFPYCMGTGIHSPIKD